MQRIKVEQAGVDMVIAHPIESSGGQVLCAKGTKLTESLITRLEKIEITHILVEGHPVDDGKRRETLEEDLSALDRRFRTVLDIKLMGALKTIVQKYIRKKHLRNLEEEGEDVEHQEKEDIEAETTPGP